MNAIRLETPQSRTRPAQLIFHQILDSSFMGGGPALRRAVDRIRYNENGIAGVRYRNRRQKVQPSIAE